MQSRNATLAAVLALACTASAGAQSIEQQVKAKGDGVVQLVFASKPGVCGDGATFVSMGMDEEGRHTTFTQSEGSFSINNGRWNRERVCDEGPVRVDLKVDNGAVVDVDTYVGGSTIPQINVSTRAATDYLLGLAEKSQRTEVAKRSILPALFADSVDISPRLVEIGRNQSARTEVRKSAIFWLGQSKAPIAADAFKGLIRDDDEEVAKSTAFALAQLDNDEGARILIEAARDDKLSSEVRKSAIFWLGQAAGNKATEGLTSLLSDEDTEVKKSAVFALSQINSDQSVDALIDVVKNSKDKEVRKSAMFWLAQSGDPRVLALFEDILLQ